MMKIESLIATAADWNGGPWAERMNQAASLLFVHGYITRAQREKVARTIDKQIADALAKGEIAPAQGIEAEGGDAKSGPVRKHESPVAAGHAP